MIQIHEVTRKYGPKTAVAGLTLEIPAGEVFAFLGPNGAGKTTTIKMLVGLLRPTEGNLAVCGCNVVANPREASSLLGYVPDQAFLYDKLSGREFLEFIGDVRGLDRLLLAERLQRETEYFHLGGFLDDLVESYSHGMRQRLVFASALLHDPPVLVVDEPMVGLDPRSSRVVKDRFRHHADAGGTVFMSTHTLDVAEEIADRIGIVDRGRLKFLGTLTELRLVLAQQQSSLERLFLQLTTEEEGPEGGDGAADVPGPRPAGQTGADGDRAGRRADRPRHTRARE